MLLLHQKMTNNGEKQPLFLNFKHLATAWALSLKLIYKHG